jgi:hypothetical protein
MDRPPAHGTGGRHFAFGGRGSILLSIQLDHGNDSKTFITIRKRVGFLCISSCPVGWL